MKTTRAAAKHILLDKLKQHDKTKPRKPRKLLTKQGYPTEAYLRWMVANRMWWGIRSNIVLTALADPKQKLKLKWIGFGNDNLPIHAKEPT